MRIAIWMQHAHVPCFSFTDENTASLASYLPNAEVINCSTREIFLETLSDTDIAVVWRFEQEWFAAAPRLQWLCTPAAGKDYFDVTPPSGVEMHYGSFHGELMAETVLAMMLAACRGVLATAWAQQGNLWPRDVLAPIMRPLRDSHVMILGFGQIGEWIARLAKPFGVHITGVRRHPSTRPTCFDETDQLRPPAEIDTLLPTVDHLVLALPRSPETDNILDATRIGRLPSHAYIYNVGRGNAIDETALAAALNAGQIAGACLDVFQTEPLPDDSPLRACPNILRMPHASAFSPNYMTLFAKELAERVKARFL